MLQLPRKRKTHTNRNFFLLGLTAGSAYQANRHPVSFFLSVIILLALGVMLALFLIGQWWFWLVVVLLLAAFSIGKANEVHPGWTRDLWRNAFPQRRTGPAATSVADFRTRAASHLAIGPASSNAQEGSTTGVGAPDFRVPADSKPTNGVPSPTAQQGGVGETMYAPGFEIPANADPIPSHWIPCDIRRGLVSETNRQRPAELAWIRFIDERNVDVKIDGTRQVFKSDIYHICYFTYQNLGGGFIKVGVQGGAQYKPDIGTIRLNSDGNWRGRANNPKANDFDEPQWELASLQLFNLFEGRTT
jgi:hypothetical protein